MAGNKEVEARRSLLLAVQRELSVGGGLRFCLDTVAERYPSAGVQELVDEFDHLATRVAQVRAERMSR